MQLKNYQKETLAVLRDYFGRLDEQTPREAYEAVTASVEMRARLGALRGYADSLDGAPLVSIKVPTGGGKTIIAAHAVKLMAECEGREYPLVVWFAPSETIRRQTADALKKARHPYRAALDEAFGGRVCVYDLDEVSQMTPSDLAGNACVVVATEQAFVKRDTSKYNVYRHSEAFEPHFASIPFEEGMEELEDDAVGGGRGATALPNASPRPKYSFANLVRSRRPIVIVDEAHKMASELSRETLARLGASAALGLTATPERGNNTVYGVAAKELFDEQMIKLPVELTEFRGDWQTAVLAALAKRQELERLADAERARGEGGFLRPLVLFQAQAKTKTAEVPVEVLKSFLVETAKVKEAEIAIVTGEQRELDGIDVTDPKSPVRCIITVQALKEGWDCPSAYVLCSVANVSSGTDTIQLLGRVMRQPGARRRKTPQLNRAYAFVMSAAFGAAAAELAEGLRRRGFDEGEAAAAIVVQPPLAGTDDESWREEGLFANPTALVLEGGVYEDVAGDLPPEVRVVANADGSGMLEIGDASALTAEVERKVVAALEAKGHADVAARFAKKAARARRLAAEEVPAATHPMAFEPVRAFVQGELCWTADDAWELVGQGVETELPATLAADEVPCARAAGDTFELRLDGNKMRQQFVQSEMDALLRDLKTDYAAGDVVNELNRLVVCARMSPAAKFGWLVGIVNDLVAVKGLKPVELYAMRYRLKPRLEQLIAEAAARVRAKAYQAVFDLGQTAYPLELDVSRAVAFDAKTYADIPLLKVYSGGYRFAKHYLGPNRVPAFDGQLAHGEGEEFECAKQIDAHPKVVTWLRQLDRCEQSFSLPVPDGRFYPDFVGELDDGRRFAVEYKGDHLRNTADTLAKDAIGRLWAAKSGGRFVYATVYKTDGGFDVRGQLDRAFGRRGK